MPRVLDHVRQAFAADEVRRHLDTPVEPIDRGLDGDG
jgi:hypothetical protein